MLVVKLLSVLCSIACTLAKPAVQQRDAQVIDNARRQAKGIAPKVFIISMFTPEAEVWHGIPEFNLLAHNVTVAGFSPLFPDAHCTDDYEVCQLVTGEGEINAAATISALALSPVFDLRQTYFLIAGIVGVNPRTATAAAVTFARYEVQVALQYEIDPRDLPNNFSTGYFPLHSNAPSEYPSTIYGTEVFELNSKLRDSAMDLVRAANVSLNDSSAAEAYRKLYAQAPGDVYAAALKPPSLVACDGVTSDVYFSGTILNEGFENYTRLVTNGSGVYCGTGQEDSATLEALLRSSAGNRTDFGRIIAMRTCSDFAAPPPGISNFQNLRFAHQDAFQPALENIRIAGVPIVQGILKGWNSTYARGVKAENYIGDILGTLGGNRDFGPVQGNDNPIKRDIEYAPMGSRGRRAVRSFKSSLLPKMRLSRE